MTIISIILPFMYTIFVFILRNADPVKRN